MLTLPWLPAARLPPLQLWCAIAMGDMHTARLAATELAGEKGGRILPEILRPRNWAKVSKEERQRVRQCAAPAACAVPCHCAAWGAGSPAEPQPWQLATGTEVAGWCMLCMGLQLRQEAGVGSFADLAAVLTEAPKPLLDSLRQSAVVRHSGKQLAWMPARGRGCRPRGLRMCGGQHCCPLLRSPRFGGQRSATRRACLRAATLLGATLADRLRVNATWALRGMLASKPGQGPAQFVGGLQSRLS